MRLYLAGAVRPVGIRPRRPVHQQSIFCERTRTSTLSAASPGLLSSSCRNGDALALAASVAHHGRRTIRKNSPNTKYRSRSALLQERASKLVSGGEDGSILSRLKSSE